MRPKKFFTPVAGIKSRNFRDELIYFIEREEIF